MMFVNRISLSTSCSICLPDTSIQSSSRGDSRRHFQSCNTSIPIAQLVAEIPTNAPYHDLLVEVATFEQIFRGTNPGICPSSLNTMPLAPEPLHLLLREPPRPSRRVRPLRASIRVCRKPEYAAAGAPSVAPVT